MKLQKKIPLGLSSYRTIRRDNYYYVDKTAHIEKLENLDARFQVFLRPRRFGKTLFVDTMRLYYDINQTENFDTLFGDTYIGRNKTPLANSFYVLHLNLSGLDSRDPERLEDSFGQAIKAKIKQFINYYNLPITVNEEMHFVSYMNTFLTELGTLQQNQLFIMIDEYDHFANSLLSNKEDFEIATSKDGFIRSFYEVLKSHTQELIARIFITGVTSLTLDSLTSGFNICENISDYGALNDALGFTYEEVLEMIRHLDISDYDKVLQILKENYNGYLFSPMTEERIYNSNMILYFFNSFMNRGYPEHLADPNIRGDFMKLTAMFDLYTENIEKEAVLQSIMSNESVNGKLETSFGLLSSFTYDQFISLLYYLGLLTIDRRLSGGVYQFKTPNDVIRQIYFDYYYKYLTEKAGIKTEEVKLALREFERDEDISLLIKVIENIIEEFTRSNNRYMIHFRENTLQTLFFLMLRNSNTYRVQMEYKVDNNYIDILYSPLDTGSAYAIELKYISQTKANVDQEAVEELKQAAEKQVRADVAALETARGVGIVFAGKNCVYHEVIGGE